MEDNQIINDKKNMIRGILNNKIRVFISDDFRCMAEDEDEDNELNGYPQLGYNDDVRNLEYLYYLSQINNINECIEQMIVEYENDGELNDLLNPKNGWIREYLYNYIKFPKTNADVTLEDMAKFINN